VNSIAAIDTVPELPWEASEAIASWRRTIGGANANKTGLFERAAIELLRVAEKQVDAGARQALIDEVAQLAVDAAIEPDEAQTIMAAAVKAPADEPSKSELAPSRDRAAVAPVPKPLLLSKAEFIAGFVPPDYLIDGILQRRFVYALTGVTGHGKTALAYLIARLVGARDAKHAFFGGHAVDKGNVVYFAGENPDDLRMRVIADDWQEQRSGGDDTISFIPGTFSLDVMADECRAKAAQMGGALDLVIVDTSAAYFLGNEENNNAQSGSHARTMRRLTELPGGPCVLVLCHPVKNASDQSQLVPRGGGAFIAEMDGNLTVWKSDDTLIELWHSKMRGPGFEPMTFRLQRIDCDLLIDAKGRHVPSVRAVPVSDHDQAIITKSTRSDEDRLLAAMLKPERSIADLAIASGWMLASGEPHKSKTQRRLIGLEKSGLARKVRGAWELTEKGKTAAGAAARAAE
jgi:hypothetical protein